MFVVDTQTNAGVVNSKLVVEKSGSEINFKFGKILDYETTRLIAGKDVKVNTRCKLTKGSATIGLFVYNGEPDKYPSTIATNIAGDSTQTTVGWSLASTTQLSADGVNESDTTTFTVPSDAVNVAFLLMPSSKTADFYMELISMTIAVAKPFSEWLVYSNEPNNQKTLLSIKTLQGFCNVILCSW